MKQTPKQLINDAIVFMPQYVPGKFLREPRAFNQKLARLKIFDRSPLKLRCVDKLAVRGSDCSLLKSDA